MIHHPFFTLDQETDEWVVVGHPADVKIGPVLVHTKSGKEKTVNIKRLGDVFDHAGYPRVKGYTSDPISQERLIYFIKKTMDRACRELESASTKIEMAMAKMDTVHVRMEQLENMIKEGREFLNDAPANR